MTKTYNMFADARINTVRIKRYFADGVHNAENFRNFVLNLISSTPLKGDYHADQIAELLSILALVMDDETTGPMRSRDWYKLAMKLLDTLECDETWLEHDVGEHAWQLRWPQA